MLPTVELANHDIIVMGGSAGAVEASRQVMAGLPSDFPASIFFVLHTSPESPGFLPRIIQRRARLKSEYPPDGTPIECGRIYIAPPDYHLLVRNGCMRVVRGPKENRHRPAIDPLFRSAARAYGARVIGVLLSGVMDDGTAGLQAIKERGGIAVVQDPKDAAHSQMPANALIYVKADYVVPASEMAALLVQLVREPAAPAPPAPKDMQKESDIAEIDMEAIENNDKPGKPSPFVCPDCNGVLWEITEGDLDRFRCRVGHSYSSESILAAKEEAVESALWAAVRALEESASLAERSAVRADRRRFNAIASRFRERAENSREHARLLRDILLTTPALETTDPETQEPPQQLTGTG